MAANAPLLRRLAKWLLIALVTLAALAALALLTLSTAPGRGFIKDQIEATEFANGFSVGVEAIDGSLFGAMTLRDLTLSDPQGVFARAPVVEIVWNPLAFALGRIEIEKARAETATLERAPEFLETPPSDAPFFPDYAIAIDAFALDRLVIEAPVTGAQRIATITGKARIEDSRAQVTLDAASLADGDASGDRLALVLDAVPDDNRLDLNAALSAPADGIITALAPWSGALEARIEGEGDWTRWDGRLEAVLDEEETVSLALTARNGTLGAEGSARLAQMVPSAGSALFEGNTNIALEARIEEPITAVAARMSNASFSFEGQGGVGFSASQFDNFEGELRVSDASAIADSVSGSGIRARFMLNGALTRPDLAYTLTADRITASDYGVEDFEASGSTTIDTAQMRVPISARARRVVGLDTAAGGPLKDVRLTGDVIVSWPRVLSDNLRLRSSRLDATITVLANGQEGRYGGALEGRLGGYALQSVGLFDAATGARFNGDVGAGVALEGSIQARSTALTNAGARALTGGDTTLSSDVLYGRDGVTRLSNIRLASPRLRVADGGGEYSAQGVMDITLSGQSSDYGPLGLTLGGTLAQPVATLTAARPDVGVGLADLTAIIRGDNGLYAIDAEGGSDFGPFTASMTADYSGERAVIDLARGEIGGVGFAGRLEQSADGPFVGDLNALGRGLSGTVRLANVNTVQTADIALKADGLRLPGAANAGIGRGQITANITLRDEPEIAANIELANARYFGTSIETLSAKANLKGGLGTAKVQAQGRNAFPFRLDVKADLEPNLWRAEVAGDVRGLTFKTASTARIVPGDEGYTLLPTRLAFKEGSVRLAGELGPSVTVQARLDDLNLAIANRFAPGLGIGGKATGAVDFTQDSDVAVPTATARLAIRGFSRSTALAVSRPVNVNVAADLGPGLAEAKAVARQNGEVIGRLNSSVRLADTAQGDWIDELLRAPLSGGARYSGSAETAFSLLGFADQSLTGPIGIAADFSGRLERPALEGIIKANALNNENQTYGTRLSDMRLSARFDGDQLVVDSLTAAAGKGRVEADGTISLSAEKGFPMDLAFSLDRAQLARSQDLAARATGELTLTKKPGERSVLAGTLLLPETRYTLAALDVVEVPELTAVRFASQVAEGSTETDSAKEPGLRDLRLDLKLVARDELFVTGLGLDSEWQADLRVTGTSADPRLSGSIDLIRGSLDFAGRAFAIEEGRVRFAGGASLEPTIAITATERIDDVAVAVNVSGKAFTPQFEFSSTPGLPQDEIVSRILFGSSIARLSALEAVQLAQSLNALNGSGGGLNPLGRVRSLTGVDRLRLLAADEANGRGTALAAGQYISDDIYVEVITDARGFTATQLELSLSPTLSVLSQASGVGATNVNLRYRKDY